MYEYYFTFRSVTRAQAALVTLTQAGLRSTLVRIPKKLSQIGCGYALKLSEKDAYAAALALRQNGPSFNRCLKVGPDGEMEEAYL